MLQTNFLFFIIGILIALTIHEASHALVAYWLGDPTAKKAGRLTLNPFKHLDLWGSILFLIANIGWGKPVPTNPTYFKNPKRDSALVALAGPASNILLAMTLAVPFKAMAPSNLRLLIHITLEINVILAALNFIPIPPLDGSKILSIFVPKHIYYKYFNFIQGNLSYIIIFFFADIYLLNAIFGFSIIGSIVGFLSDIIRTIIFLGT